MFNLMLFRTDEVRQKAAKSLRNYVCIIELGYGKEKKKKEKRIREGRALLFNFIKFKF